MTKINKVQKFKRVYKKIPRTDHILDEVDLNSVFKI